ncbi:MAG TPA: RHS repeat-associated core domain-containing protein [Dermatophilaceae bacterium]|nr:RHS repeat-associated core domain-containing protein [Dermatophilaceae bacterium]
MRGVAEGVDSLTQHGARWTLSSALDAAAVARGEITPEELAMRVRVTGEQVSTLAEQLRHDPVDTVRELAKSAVDWRLLLRDPHRAVGRLVYDPLGRRVAKERLDAAGEVVEWTRFTWDGPRLIEQRRVGAGDGEQAVVTTWEHLGWQPVAQVERSEQGSRFDLVVTDLVGLPTALVGADGVVSWQARHTTWGAAAEVVGDLERMPLRFPGQYADAETGLFLNVFRHYDPLLGRYVSTDPLGLSPYAPNNPERGMSLIERADGFLPGLPKTAPKPLGLGSTGRVEPAN